MSKGLILFLTIFLVFGAVSIVFAQPGFGPGAMMGPGMMESVDSEYDYLVKMIPHHEEAVSKAKILRDNTNREEMRKFAKDIIKVQTQEIKEMKKYLAEWYPDKTNNYQYQPMMGDYKGLSGEELDYAFLQDMIFHHMGAVMMSQQLIVQDLAEHRSVFLLARSIRDSQRQEIFMMQDWLNQWY
ncbi:DUF305 domain-containing protein [Halanaerobium sp. ST460_2HS_T2]|uniref:DUF305 domain-containing protein n=1 Tax=Halanaerobium sp. ST460_2HS_T2 TaxID=2183914 RepID=UPI000DF34871|nr:DUF305 domain-containing protein [Halanaerobium sp. ST460_2HS_T2]RCW50622.1 uncharacterized protein (DUF305 family) [Halanaerobium sp. ST460_2HS_T2]